MLSQREIDRITNLNTDALGIDPHDKIMLNSAINNLGKAVAARNEKAFAEAYTNFMQWVEFCDKKLEIAALLGSGEHIPDDAYDNFLKTGDIDKKYLFTIAGNIFNNRPLKPREQIIYNAHKKEIDDLVAKSSQGGAATPKVKPESQQSTGASSKDTQAGRIDYAKVDRSRFLKQAREAETNNLAAYRQIAVTGYDDKRCKGNCSAVLVTASGDAIIDGVVYGKIQSTGSGDVKAHALKGEVVVGGSGDAKISHMLAGSRVIVSGSGDFIGKHNYDTLTVLLSGSGDATIKNNYGKILLKISGDADFYLGDAILEPGVIFPDQQIYEENGTIYIEYVGPGNGRNLLQAKKGTSASSGTFVSGSRNVIIGDITGGDFVLGDTVVSQFNMGGSSIRIQHMSTSGISVRNGTVSFDGKSIEDYIKKGKSTFFGTLKSECDSAEINNQIKIGNVTVYDYIGAGFRAFKVTKSGLTTIVVIYDDSQILYARN